MENFKFWILSLCGATAISSIFRILLSNSSLKKVVNIFLSLFVLFYTIMPIQAFLNELSFSDENIEVSKDFEKYYVYGYEQIIETSIKNECEKISVKVLSINIESYIDKDGNLLVESIDIKIDNNARSEEIKSQIKSRLGFEVNVA